MKLSSPTHPHVVPNLYDILSVVEHKRRRFENDFFFVHTIKVKGVHSC